MKQALIGSSMVSYVRFAVLFILASLQIEAGENDTNVASQSNSAGIKSARRQAWLKAKEEYNCALTNDLTVVEAYQTLFKAKRKVDAELVAIARARFPVEQTRRDRLFAQKLVASSAYLEWCEIQDKYEQLAYGYRRDLLIQQAKHQKQENIDYLPLTSLIQEPECAVLHRKMSESLKIAELAHTQRDRIECQIGATDPDLQVLHDEEIHISQLRNELITEMEKTNRLSLEYNAARRAYQEALQSPEIQAAENRMNAAFQAYAKVTTGDERFTLDMADERAATRGAMEVPGKTAASPAVKPSSSSTGR